MEEDKRNELHLLKSIDKNLGYIKTVVEWVVWLTIAGLVFGIWSLVAYLNS